MTSPHVRPAFPGDFDALLDIRQEVADDLMRRGVPSGPNGLRRHHLEEWTAAEVLWVGELDGDLVGSVAVWFHDPTGYWPRADLAAYIRDLMVHPRHRGHGIGVAMLGWAERFAAGCGRHQVRLDCDASNARLRRYYREAGYCYVSTDDEGFALFKKALG